MKQRMMKLWVVLLFGMFLLTTACADSDDDDDPADGGTDDDNTDDDDNDDDQTDDDVVTDDDVTPASPHEQITLVDEDGKLIEMIAGGMPGNAGDGVDAVYLPDGTLVAAAVKGRTLKIYYVDPDGNISEERIRHYVLAPRLLADADGNLYVICQDTRHERLVLGKRTAKGWQFENIVEYTFDPSETTRPVSAVLDDQGFIHLAFVYQNSASPYYATNASGAWVVEKAADLNDGLYESPVIALDADGRPNLIFNYGKQWAHLIRNSDKWSGEQIDVEDWCGRAALRNSPDNTLTLFLHCVGEELLYFSLWRYTNANWTEEKVTLDDLQPDAATFNFDADGNPFVFFTDEALDNPGDTFFWFATKKYDVWQTEYLGQGNAWIYYSSAVSSMKPPTAVMTGPGWGQLSYVRDDGNGWATGLLDNAGDGKAGEIALSSNDEPYFGFEIRNSQDGVGRVWLGQLSAGLWNFSEVDDGWPPSLALDENDLPHMVYWNTETEELRYAYSDEMQWNKATLDTGSYIEYPQFETYDITFNNLNQPGITAIGDNGIEDFPGFKWMVYLEDPYGEPEWVTWNEYEIAYSIELLYNDENNPRIVNSYLHYDYYNEWEKLRFYWPGEEGEPWNYEEIHPNDSAHFRVGSHSDAVLAPDGTVYVSYTAELSGVMMATGDLIGDNGAWQLNNLPDGILNSYFPTAIAIDPTGKPVVAFMDEDAFTHIYVGVSAPNGWHILKVDEGRYYNQRLDMAIAQDGTVHLVYDGDGAVWHAQIPIEKIEEAPVWTAR